jgi:hypothetical protein
MVFFAPGKSIGVKVTTPPCAKGVWPTPRLISTIVMNRENVRMFFAYEVLEGRNRPGSEFHQGNISGLSGLQTSYAGPLSYAFLN